MHRDSGRAGRHRHDPAHLLFDVEDDKIVFPLWAPLGAAVLAVVLGLAVAIDRGALASPGWDTVFVALAVLPWVLDVVIFLKFRGTRGTGVPLPLFIVAVLAG